jgi:hypothetical protein
MERSGFCMGIVPSSLPPSGLPHRGPMQISLSKKHWMSRSSRPHYRIDLGWILGIAFVGTLTRSIRPAQGFTFVRCCGSPRTSSPHGLAAPAP